MATPSCLFCSSSRISEAFSAERITANRATLLVRLPQESQVEAFE